MEINCGKCLDSCAFQLRCDENVVTKSFVGEKLHLARDVLPFVDRKRLVEQQTALQDKGRRLGVHQGSFEYLIPMGTRVLWRG